MVQSCLWVITPLNSSGYFPSESTSLAEKGTDVFIDECKGIFSDLMDTFREAVELFLPSKAFAGPSCGSYIPIDEQLFKSKDLHLTSGSFQSRIIYQ